MNRKYFQVDLILQEWGAAKWPPRVRRYMRQVLGELGAEAQMILRAEPKVQVVVHLGSADFDCWASFPMHKNRTEFKALMDCGIYVRPDCRVLFTITDGKPSCPPLEPLWLLRDHLGHTLLYLRSPKANNDCKDAMREWYESCGEVKTK